LIYNESIRTIKRIGTVLSILCAIIYIAKLRNFLVKRLPYFDLVIIQIPMFIVEVVLNIAVISLIVSLSLRIKNPILLIISVIELTLITLRYLAVFYMIYVFETVSRFVLSLIFLPIRMLSVLCLVDYITFVIVLLSFIVYSALELLLYRIFDNQYFLISSLVLVSLSTCLALIEFFRRVLLVHIVSTINQLEACLHKLDDLFAGLYYGLNVLHFAILTLAFANLKPRSISLC